MNSKILHKMRAALLLLGLCLAGNILQAQTYTFTNATATGINGPTQAMVTTAYSSTNLAGSVTVTGAGIQNWSVPVAGLYKIEVYGANGYGVYGGKGAYMSGEFNFNASDVLQILVGQQGACCNGSGTNQFGGGGGSFVVDATNNPLIIAGGGGGAATFYNNINLASSHNPVADASITTSGKTASGSTVGAGGTAGGGGAAGNTGGGGGGFLTDGLPSPQGGKSFLNGGIGGAGTSGLGGFGGGGGISGQNNMRGGGGGGYSGGGGAGSSTTVPQIGGGGGSFNSGANQVNTPGLGTGHGSVVITLLAPAVMVPNNTGVTGFPSLTGGICPGSQTVSIKVRNFGNNQVTSVKIAWEVNGVLQTDNVYPVSIDPYPGPVFEQTINVGTFNFTPGTHTIKAWTSLPNNQADPVATNDTSTFTVPVSLTGIYTVNSAQPTAGTNYQTFSDMANALANYGICGPVVINVATGSGPYNEQVTIPQITGSSTTNTITINGNGTTLTFAGTAAAMHTLGLNGADYITVNNLNVIGTDATNALVCHLWNDADNNNFNNCTFSAPVNSTATTTVPFSISGSPIAALTTGPSGSNNIVTGCTMISGYYNTVFYGNSGGVNTGNQLINCNLKDFYFYGAMCYYNNGMVIRGNTIERPTRTTLSTFYGVYVLTGSTNTLVENNRIRNPFATSTTNTSTAYGIYSSIDASVGNENKYINNVISDFEGSGTHGGIYLTGADYVKVYHNTISLDYAGATAGTTYGIYSTGTTSGIDIKNNNISITKGGSGTKYALYFSGGLQSSNNNNLYVNAPAGLNYTGYFGTAQASLAAWQAINSSAWDAASVAVDPLYINPAAGNYTPGNSMMDDMGAPVGVTTDINNAARSTTVPDIGAYEFSVPPCAGFPVAGTAAASAGSVCPNGPLAVTLTGFTIGSGISIQWEESPMGANMWMPITGANSATLNHTQTSAMDYRAIVTCANGGFTDISNTISVQMSPFYFCYCSPLTGITLHGSPVNYITAVSIPTTPLSVTTAAFGAGGYTFHNPSVATNTASLIQGQTYTLNATITNAAYATELWIDWDQNGTFDASEYTLLPASTSISYALTVPVTATPGMTGMRLRNVASTTTLHGASGACANITLGRETEDFVITIVPAVQCSGIPSNTGTATASQSAICVGAPFTLNVSNYSTDLGISVQWQQSSVGANTWTNITGATTASYSMTTATADADYRAAIICNNPGGGTAYSNTVTVTVNNPQLTGTTPGSRCGVGTVNLSATGTPGANINWYAAATGGSPLATNSPTFTTPVISATTTYYAAANMGGITTNIGRSSNLTPGDSYNTGSVGLLFDATTPFTLNSVVVYPYSATNNTAGSITIALQNSTGTTIQSATVNVTGYNTPTATTVPLNFNVPAGTGYRLIWVTPGVGITGLYREYTATPFNFPYTVPGVASILASWNGASTTAYYYYFYNWSISTGCEGTRQPVVATVTAPPAIVVAATPDTICLGSSSNISVSSSNSGYSYNWTPGGAGSSHTVAPTATTKYIVTATDASSCTAVDSVEIAVISTPASVATVSSASSVCVSGSVNLTLNPQPMAGITYQWQKNSGSGFTDIPGATSATYSEPVTANVSYQAKMYCNNNLTGTSSPVSVTYSNPSITNVFPGSRCDAGQVTLAATADAGATINWYAAATGGATLASGGAFTTPSIAATTTYYAAAVTGTGSASMPLPAHGSNFPGNVRGFYFTAPTSFTITGLQALAQTTGNQSITVVKFDNNTPPPIFGATTNAFTVLYLTQNNPATGVIPVNIQINAGEVIGVLGQVGNNTSYATPTGQYATTIAGLPTTLTRMGMQFPLGTTAPQNLWEETNGAIGRVHIEYVDGCEGARVPVTATINGTTSGTGLSTGGTTTGTLQADGTTVSYTDGCGDMVATITDAPGGNTLGVTSAIVITPPTVQTHNNLPYVSRIVDLSPASPGAATVTLYALQSEFNAYNSYVTSNSLGLPLLPTGPLDITGMNNIVVTQFHGSALSGGTGPGGLYNNANTSFIPNGSITKLWNGNYWALTFPVTGFSGFFIHSGNTPLEIDLKSITAANFGSRNRLDWTTAKEDAGDYFILERSADGRSFAALATIEAKGTASRYSFWDENPYGGINYYRLKMTDANGNVEYSKIVTATVKGKGAFTIEAFPNPVTDLLTVKVYGQAGANAMITISDVTGKTVQTVTVTDNKAEINMAGLAQGVYLVKYTDAVQSQTIKVNKQ